MNMEEYFDKLQRMARDNPPLKKSIPRSSRPHGMKNNPEPTQEK